MILVTVRVSADQRIRAVTDLRNKEKGWSRIDKKIDH